MRAPSSSPQPIRMDRHPSPIARYFASAALSGPQPSGADDWDESVDLDAEWEPEHSASTSTAERDWAEQAPTGVPGGRWGSSPVHDLDLSTDDSGSEAEPAPPAPDAAARVGPRSAQLVRAPSDLPFTRIPVVDFGEFLFGSARQQREVAARIGDACRNVGFLYLVNHGVSRELMESVFRVGVELFDLPVERKRAMAYAEGGVRGYFGYRSENLDQFKASGQRGDLKEGFDVGLERGQLPLNATTSPAFHSANHWPSGGDVPAFRPTLERYMAAMRVLASRLTEAFALSLGLSQHYFVDMCTAPCVNLRVNHYPPPPVDTPGLGCGAHTDYGLFTILMQDMVGGLQVRNSLGMWVDATPLEGSFVINIGDMMQRWTNNTYSSTVHRVIASKQRRFSVPFFYNANCDAVVECLRTCTDAARPPLFEPETAESILQNRYTAAFGKGTFKAPPAGATAAAAASAVAPAS